MIGVRPYLDALDDLHVEPVGDQDQRLDDRAALAVALDLLNEGAIDVDPINPELQRVDQRGVARSEIVERDQSTAAAQLVEIAHDRLVDLGQEDRFRGRDHEIALRKPQLSR
jgi:hypothetical protein